MALSPKRGVRSMTDDFMTSCTEPDETEAVLDLEAVRLVMMEINKRRTVWYFTSETVPAESQESPDGPHEPCIYMFRDVDTDTVVMNPAYEESFRQACIDRGYIPRHINKKEMQRRSKVAIQMMADELAARMIWLGNPYAENTFPGLDSLIYGPQDADGNSEDFLE